MIDRYDTRTLCGLACAVVVLLSMDCTKREDPVNDAAGTSPLLVETTREALAGLGREIEIPRSKAVAFTYYLWRNFKRSASASGVNPEEIIKARDAQCQGRVILFAHMASVAGLKTRMIALWDFPPQSGGSHSVAEVMIQGRWHLFDPLNGGYFTRDGSPDGEILSLAEVLSGAARFQENLQLPFHGGRPYLAEDPARNPLPKVYDPRRSPYGRDARGEIFLGLCRKSELTRYDQLPHYMAVCAGGVWEPLEWGYFRYRVPAAGGVVGEREGTGTPKDWDELPWPLASLAIGSMQKKGMELEFPPGRFDVTFRPAYLNVAKLRLSIVPSSDRISASENSIAVSRQTRAFSFTVESRGGALRTKVAAADRCFIGFDTVSFTPLP